MLNKSDGDELSSTLANLSALATIFIHLENSTSGEEDTKKSLHL